LSGASGSPPERVAPVLRRGSLLGVASDVGAAYFIVCCPPAVSHQVPNLLGPPTASAYLIEERPHPVHVLLRPAVLRVRKSLALS
jgi:hypothetical protein